MAWLIWHLSRVEDAQLASAAGLEQVWTSQGFAARFGLPLSERDTGYGHSSGQVDAVKAPPELLLEYYDAVHRQTVEFLADPRRRGLRPHRRHPLGPARHSRGAAGQHHCRLPPARGAGRLRQGLEPRAPLGEYESLAVPGDFRCGLLGHRYGCGHEL